MTPLGVNVFVKVQRWDAFSPVGILTTTGRAVIALSLQTTDVSSQVPASEDGKSSAIL